MALSAPTMAVRRAISLREGGRLESVMDRLLGKGMERLFYTLSASDPLSGFTPCRQKSGLMVCAMIVHALVVVACLTALSLTTAGPLEAQSIREPVVPGVRPGPRPVPT